MSIRGSQSCCAYNGFNSQQLLKYRLSDRRKKTAKTPLASTMQKMLSGLFFAMIGQTSCKYNLWESLNMKKIRVLFQSKKGNTRKIAQAIASVVGDVVEELPPAYPCEGVKLLFLGGGTYAGKIDKKLSDFIHTLTPQRVKNVAVFGTSGGQDAGIVQMKEMLKAQKINVLDEHFLCRGKFFLFFNGKNPDQQDIANAKAFAQRALDTVKAE